MRALTHDRYGGTEQLRLVDRPAPTAGEGELLVRVHAAAVDRGTWHVLTGTPLLARPGFGLRAPRARWRTPGRDFAGVVEAVGAGVTGWSVGDPVHGTADGSLAELVVTSVDRVARPPAALQVEEAAALPVSGLTAYQALRPLDVGDGTRVLVVGSCGGVGDRAGHLAPPPGPAGTAVGGPGAAAVARSNGARHVLVRGRDRLEQDGVRHDVVLDVASNRPRRELRGVLTERGTLVCIGTETGGSLTAGFHRSALSAALDPFVRQHLVMHVSRERGDDLAALDAVVAGSEVRPRIDRVVPLEEAAAAIDHDGAGRARGKVVVRVG